MTSDLTARAAPNQAKSVIHMIEYIIVCIGFIIYNLNKYYVGNSVCLTSYLDSNRMIGYKKGFERT